MGAGVGRRGHGCGRRPDAAAARRVREPRRAAAGGGARRVRVVCGVSRAE